MTKKANPKLIGAFVLGAVALAALGVVIFGSGRFFVERFRWVLFFPGSVKGLTVGAPVTLEGVTIGTVTDVKVVFHRDTLKFYTPVYVEVFPDRVKDVGEYSTGELEKIETDPDEIIKALVEKGLRGQLDMQSLLTGKLQVALSMYPGSELHYAGIEKGVPEIPTIPTTIQQLAKAFENLDIQGMAEDLRKTPLVVLERYYPGGSVFLNDIGQAVSSIPFWYNTQKAENTLGFSAKLSLNDVMRQYYENKKS